MRFSEFNEFPTAAETFERLRNRIINGRSKS